MKSKSLILTLVFAFCASFGFLTPVSAETAAPTTITNAVKAVVAVVVDNKNCPVCGKVLETGKGSTCEHSGKAYHVCSKACAKGFKKDAAKFSKIADDEVAAAAAAAAAPKVS